MYTHLTKKSNQLCFRACTFPLRKELQGQEKERPLMHLESGQVTRIHCSNLRKLPQKP